MEPIFHENSFGYRPGKNAHQAVRQATEQCRKKAWVLDLDIEGFFDNLDHSLMMQALKKHTTERWVLLYIERWLKAPIEHKDGKLEIPMKGSPQGGVISPLLSNLYLHYALDKWMSIHYSAIVFERYADDIIVHCTSKTEAEHLLEAITDRLKQCGLRLHPVKTKIVYCKHSNRNGKHGEVSFDFLGFKFKPRKAKNRTTGQIFTDFGPDSISTKSLKRILALIRSKNLHRRVTDDLVVLSADLTAHVRGWINYFGRMKMQFLYPIANSINERLLLRARNRYKTLHGSQWQSRKWLRGIYHDYPHMFEHWKYGFKP